MDTVQCDRYYDLGMSVRVSTKTLDIPGNTVVIWHQTQNIGLRQEPNNLRIQTYKYLSSQRCMNWLYDQRQNF